MSRKQTALDFDTEGGQPPAPRRRFSWSKFAGFCTLIGMLVGGTWLLWAVGNRFGTVTGESIAEYVKSLGVWGHFSLIGLMVAHSFVPFPAEVVAVVAGMCFGIVWGTVLTWAGAMVGALLAFGLSRKLGRPFVAELLGQKRLAGVDAWSSQASVATLLIVRLIPVIAFNLVNYGAGLTRISWWTFTWTTAIGILPMTVLMVMMGDQMREPNWRDWMLLVGAGTAVTIVVVLARRSGIARQG